MTSSVDDMMKKAVTSSKSFFQDAHAVVGVKDRKDAVRAKRKEEKGTLSQWYGIKKSVLSADEKQELELLKYRNFVNPERRHQAPTKTGGASSEFVEFGFFADVGKNKRRRYKSFADEWVEENPEFDEIVSKRMKRNIKANKKAKAVAVKRVAAEKARNAARHTSKRKSKHDDGF